MDPSASTHLKSTLQRGPPPHAHGLPRTKSPTPAPRSPRAHAGKDGGTELTGVGGFVGGRGAAMAAASARAAATAAVAAVRPLVSAARR